MAAAICRAQGADGQWWWHYDARTGGTVEGYPVYSVHQHAMAPMALLDLADAGGPCHLGNISRGLRWLDGPPETGERLVLDDPPVTWRKVARGDRGKAVRGLRAPHVQGRLMPRMATRTRSRCADWPSFWRWLPTAFWCGWREGESGFADLMWPHRTAATSHGTATMSAMRSWQGRRVTASRRR